MTSLRIEEEIKRQNTKTGDLKSVGSIAVLSRCSFVALMVSLRIVCRNGLPSSAADLWKVGADVCSRTGLAVQAMAGRTSGENRAQANHHVITIIHHQPCHHFYKRFFARYCWYCIRELLNLRNTFLATVVTVNHRWSLMSIMSHCIPYDCCFVPL